MKKILYIKNFSKGNNLECVKKFKSANIKCMESIELITYDTKQLIKLIDKYDIIILGGGKQHLTSNNILTDYPEISNQIELVKLISSKYNSSNKILIGICLGCQIIALSYGLSIIPMNKLVIGFNYMDLNTINNKYILNSNDKYLTNLDYNLLSQSFSFHYDCIDVSNLINSINSDNVDKLVIVAKSIDNVPYIITNTNSNIYGFQFHPEICSSSISNVVNLFLENQIEKYSCLLNSSNHTQLEKIQKHFFNIFINE
jgi:anthranilate/para-aminobenzoate synthase component II